MSSYEESRKQAAYERGLSGDRVGSSIFEVLVPYSDEERSANGQGLRDCAFLEEMDRRTRKSPDDNCGDNGAVVSACSESPSDPSETSAGDVDSTYSLGNIDALPRQYVESVIVSSSEANQLVALLDSRVATARYSDPHLQEVYDRYRGWGISRAQETEPLAHHLIPEVTTDPMSLEEYRRYLDGYCMGPNAKHEMEAQVAVRGALDGYSDAALQIMRSRTDKSKETFFTELVDRSPALASTTSRRQAANNFLLGVAWGLAALVPEREEWESRISWRISTAIGQIYGCAKRLDPALQ